MKKENITKTSCTVFPYFAYPFLCFTAAVRPNIYVSNAHAENEISPFLLFPKVFATNAKLPKITAK